jgi:hypothetical protein
MTGYARSPQFNIFGFIAKSCTIDDLSQGRVAGRLSGETLDLKRHDFTPRSRMIAAGTVSYKTDD